MSVTARKIDVMPAAVAYLPGQRVLHPFRPQPAAAPAAPLAEVDQRLAFALLRDGALAPHRLLQALARLSERPGRLIDILLEGQLIEPGPLFATLRRQTGLGAADLAAARDPRLIDRLGAAFCLSE
ncbi:MAG: hypothetical protein B7Y02_19250, partial [Rhodobacterales bacterium 17-64-5]